MTDAVWSRIAKGTFCAQGNPLDMLWRPSLARGRMTLVRAAFFGYKGCKEGRGVGVYSGRGEVKRVVLPKVFISRHGRIRYSAPNFLRYEHDDTRHR